MQGGRLSAQGASDGVVGRDGSGPGEAGAGEVVHGDVGRIVGLAEGSGDRLGVERERDLADGECGSTLEMDDGVVVDVVVGDVGEWQAEEEDGDSGDEHDGSRGEASHGTSKR